jgi:hypothetical protein
VQGVLEEQMEEWRRVRLANRLPRYQPDCERDEREGTQRKRQPGRIRSAMINVRQFFLREIVRPARLHCSPLQTSPAEDRSIRK